jgi:beta-glucanase (GH16 family)
MAIGDPSQAAYITPDPIAARVTNKGVRVLGIPSGIRSDANKFLYEIPDPFNEVFDGIAVANSVFTELDAYLKDYSDGSVTVQWQSGNKPVMEATFVHGSPYIYFKAFRGQIVIKTKAEDGGEKGTFYQQGNNLGLWTSVAGNRNDFLITGEGTTSFDNVSSNAVTVSNETNEVTVTLLPPNGATTPSTNTTDFFAALARNVVRKVDIDYAVNRANNSVTVSHNYLDSDGNAVETAAGMLPMAWKNSDQTLSGHKVRSARGMVQFSQTTAFSYELPFVGVLPTLPSTIGDLDNQYLIDLVTEFYDKGPSQWNLNNDGDVANDTYWAGKSYGKMAEMAAIARSIGMDSEADEFIAWLKSELADWFTADTNGSLDTQKYFVYDEEWSTLLGMQESFASHQQLNDHHFHYGYFVRAAAEICRVDAAWCGSEQYGPMIDLLIRDYAASKDDGMFPYLRNFDPANGFSWASGNANFTAGNNNESTSEAANAYGAIALYGMITGNDALVEKGMYLHASSTSAYWEYWNNIDRFRNESSEYPDRGNDYDNFPVDYNRITTSIIWGNGTSFSTWFSGAYAHILGIQGLPLNPLVLHVGQYPDYMEEYVALGLEESSNGKPSGLLDDHWRDIWWNLWAMTDADASFADYETMGSSYNPETGESKAHTYHWVKTWQALGHLKTGSGELTANHPAAIAFDNYGKTTYIAYNFGASAITVTYSDGQQLNVAANSFEVVTVGESNPPTDGGDDSGTGGDDSGTGGDDSGTGGDDSGTGGDELLANGSFENGIDGWNGGTVIAEGDSNVFTADVAAPGNPWDVNLSQVMTITPDATYVLSFKAKASVARNIIAGLGLAHDPWTNITETPALTTEWQTFTYTLTTSGFGDDNSRVLFDMGAEAGTVYLDDISVVQVGGDTGTGGDDSGTGGDDTGGDTTPSGLAAIDFEDDGVGAAFAWNVFENDDNPAVEIVANPYSGGTNPSSTVAMFTARQSGAAWAGAESAHGDFGPITLDATNSIVKIMVYKTVISDVGVKFAIASGGAQPEIKVANTLINEWEELSFDFSGQIGTAESINIDQVIVFPDYNATRENDNVVYFDNITLNGGGDSGTGGDDSGTGGDDSGTGGDDSGTGGDTGTSTGIELSINGDFETGDTSSWTSFATDNNGTFEATSTEANGGIFSGNLVANVPAEGGLASFPVVKQANIGIGSVAPDTAITVSFDLKGSMAGVGGVVFAELFSELADGGVSKAELLGSGPMFPNATWTNYTFTTTTGNDVSGGVTLQLKADCGGNPGCMIDAYFDNVSVNVEGDDSGTGGDDSGTGGDDSGTGGDDSGTGGDELLANGSFENGTEGWNGGTVIAEGDNNVFTADVAAPGNPWDVNLSQVMTITPDATYVLSFKAKASVERNIIAGLGLAHDPWTNITETPALTTEWQTFTYTLTTSGFGDDNSRVLFDMGAEAGTVYLDDISVTIQASGDDETNTGGKTPSENWSMVWNDEFDGSDIDLSKWEHEVNCDGGGNNEKQCYTSNPENSFVDSGLLKIVAKPESGQAQPYSSARMRTKYQGDWKYGRVEVRAKPPQGQGSFPAIWMLPSDDVYGGWPHSGEIDIFESVNLKTVNDQGVEEAGIHGNLWYGSSWPNQSNSGDHTTLPDGQNPADGFHTYAIEWEEGEMRWYVDDVLYQTQTKSEVNVDIDGDANGLTHRGWFADYDGEAHWDNAPFDQRFHLILNFAVGGTWSEVVNNKGIDASAFGANNAFEFDYVRVYECSVDPVTGQGCATTHDGYKAPVDEGGTLVDGAAPIPVKPSTGIATDLIVFENTSNDEWPAWASNEETTSTIVTDDVEHDQVVEFSMGAAAAVAGFNNAKAEIPAPYDGSPMLNNGWLEFDMKLVTPPNNVNANWNLKVEQGGASSEAVIRIDTPTSQWQHYAFSLRDLNNAGLALNGIDVIMLFPDWGQGEGAVFRVDNITILQGEETGGDDSGSGGDTGGDSGPAAGEEILNNGSFENGLDNWTDVGFTGTEGDNTFYQADVELAGNAWDVNLSQVMTLTPGETYVLSFKAKASIGRSIIAGLGLNSDPWTNVTETVELSTQWETYTYVLTTTGFGDDNSRVLFDLGADVGLVSIDDVSVSIQGDTSGNTGGGDTGGPVAGDEFVIVASTGATDVSFTPDTIGEWSTGTTIQADVIFDGLLGWELTSSSNSPEQGNWGTVLAFQNGFIGDFSLFNRVELKLATSGGYSGGFKVAISGNGVSKEISLPVDQGSSTWQTISIDAADIPVNMSSIDSIAVYGIGGQTGVSTINVTDFSLIKDEAIAFDSVTENDYVFISSDAGIASDLVVDDDNNSAAGNIIFGEWSTGTAISDINYSGLDAIQLTAGGGWGAVLALQGDISDGVNVDNYDVDMANYTNIKFKVASQGAFERYALSIVSKVGANETAQEVNFSLANQDQWNDIDIDLAQYGVNLSNVNQIAVFGVYAGGSASQKVYITDMVLYDTGKVTPVKDSSDDKFVFFSSTGESSDMIFDGDDTAHNGNTTISEWSTGTTLTADVTYSGLNAFQLTKGAGWGAVLALMGDIYGGVQEYKLDVAKYSTINFKIAAQGAFSAYFINFIVDGAEFKVPLTVGTSWNDVSINVADLPLNLSKLTQIAIYGEGGGAGNTIYITDLNISK